MSIVNHPIWPKIASYFVVERYARDGGSSKRARKRIEFRLMPMDLLQAALLVEVECPSCGAMHHPIRQRQDRSIYFAAACPLHVSVPCSRSRLAAQEYANVAAAVEREAPRVIPEREHVMT